METPVSDPASIRVALEGCGHGCLHDIYASVEKSAALKGWDGVDLVIIGGDFQAVRNSNDLACMSVPNKYKEMGDFHEYYSGQRTAPYLTIFIGGNHEASNHLFELYYGGWVAPNIYYLGAANVIRCGPLRISGMSGIWKGYDYRKPHFERLPYSRDDLQSIYHIRELDVRKLLQVRTQVDLGLSHDWPKQVEYGGDYETLFRVKRGFREDSENGRLGSMAAKHVLDRLRPAYWFSAHLHVHFASLIQHGDYVVPQHPAMRRQAAIASNDIHQPPKAIHPFGLDGSAVTSMVFGEDNQPGGNPFSLRTADIGLDSAVEEESNAGEAENTQTISDSDQTTQEALPRSLPTKPAMGLSAWNNFHAVATEAEAAENSRFLSEQRDGQDSSPPDIKHNLTWRRIDTNEDGSGRRVLSIEKDGVTESGNKKQKTQHEPEAVKNSDEIDLDLDSDSDDGVTVKVQPVMEASKPEVAPPAKPATDVLQSSSGNAHTGVPDDVRDQLPASFARPQPTFPSNATGVSDDVRNQLPASFARPQPDPYPINEPLPAAISNKTTSFLALDKCLPNRDFLQLVEFHAISDQEGVQSERPYCLQYDKEWLAITRAFADDLHLGEPGAKPSADKGDSLYKPLIIEEEKWVEENVVKPGRLLVPENFTQTAPVYDAAVPITTDEQPMEFTNPQTTQFCELIGITNKFHLSDEERQARMASGPRPGESRRDRPRRGGFGFGRGRGGRGRGRGNRR
ncbi:DBR1-domain-containing protein [Aspergillus heteromorphus CBS 117.55]|uniref:DBR1-domain-containing protein n=1 Tax=Aspergillus heteromorphus CBS 117.55 TaxID=1448321 RepID=A0A317V2C6_9EURO|nr:DBR1-domain-containing protein [Aspergillus heteromorphus CBS 117.55]PWY68454.1 DBR1-domain-containing protein [Aspergillus heteromorphus CBS 117.55]